MKKKIYWITADYFIDVDFLLVPYLQKHSDLDIEWIVLQGSRSNIDILESLNCRKYKLRYRYKDPRIVLDYATIFKEINEKNIDIIYSDYLGTPFYYPVLFTYSKKIPVIHAAHNVIPYQGWPNRRLMTCYINYIFRKNHYFQIFSKHLTSFFEEKYPEKSVFYCPMTVKGYGDVQTSKYRIDKSKTNLLFFGNIKSNKRLDLLIAAIKMLSEESKSKIHLTIAGKCEEIAKYTSLISDCECISAYLNRIDDREIAELFTKHDFLVLPYEEVAQSGPQMIAYYYNLPVIASNINGFNEKIVDKVNGFLFEVNNIESLKKTIKQVIDLSETQRDTMKRNLRQYINDNYSLECIALQYLEYFKTIRSC